MATAPYPLTAHQWPAATAPVTQTWPAYDALVQLDLVGQGASGGWYRALRFGHAASGPYWLPASAVTVTGSTTDLAQAPGGPGELAPPVATHDSVTLSWTAPTTGGTVTGYRLWRQRGEADFTVLGADLAADVLTYTDTGLDPETAYQYRVAGGVGGRCGPQGRSRGRDHGGDAARTRDTPGLDGTAYGRQSNAIELGGAPGSGHAAADRLPD